MNDSPYPTSTTPLLIAILVELSTKMAISLHIAPTAALCQDGLRDSVNFPTNP